MYLKESCFPGCCKVSLVVSVFKNVRERCRAKNYGPVSLLSVVSKVFEKFANNRLVSHVEKYGLFSDFQYGFRSSHCTADCWVVGTFAGTFNRSGVARAVALDISKAFNRVWHADCFHKLTVLEFWVKHLPLFHNLSLIGGFEWFWVESLYKNTQLIL